MIGADGRIIRTARLAAGGGDQALTPASALVDDHAVDLWDGLRFIEHLDPVHP